MYQQRELFFNAKKVADPIQHVIVLMMENNSFDRKLGDIHHSKPELDGIDSEHLRTNPDDRGMPIVQNQTLKRQMALDPFHEVGDVAEQLMNNNSGFVTNFIKNYPKATSNDQNEVMAYYPDGVLPAMHPLAKEFMVCDNWYSSLPGPTWANRFFALSGTSNGCVRMLNGVADLKNIPQLWKQTQTTLFDRLDEKGVSWRVYCGDFPLSVILTHNRELRKLKNYHGMHCFYEDVLGDPKNFPAFTFIEPRYMGSEQNDDHPPHNTMKAEKLIADVYNAIRSNEALWENTLLVVTYDEHGGFYDHKVPPPAIPPDDERQEGYGFDQYGLAVPALIISPYAENSVCHTVFDHTSILKYLIDKYQLGSLGNRTAAANSIRCALNFDKPPRKDCLQHIKIPNELLISPRPHWEKHDMNHNNANIHLFADFVTKEVYGEYKPFAKELGTIDKVSDSIGAELENLGWMNLGMFFRKGRDNYKQERIKHTMDIAYQMMPNLKPKTLAANHEVKEAEVELDAFCGLCIR